MATTQQLHYRVLIKHAATYIKYLIETDEAQLVRWSQFYNVTNVQAWAKERIANTLTTANAILKTMDTDGCTAARDAAAGSLERLSLAGFGGTVRVADIVKTESE